jgi:hypothetical protein
MSNVSLPRRVSVSPDVLFQEISGDSVLLDMASEQYFGLDDVGTRIWHLLTENSETATMMVRLLEYYDVDEAILTRDLALLIEQLKAEGLVSVEI